MNYDLVTRAANFLRWKSNFYYDLVEYLQVTQRYSSVSRKRDRIRKRKLELYCLITVDNISTYR